MDKRYPASFETGINGPLVQYGVVFQRDPKLLTSGGVLDGSMDGSRVYAGVIETFEDDIKWEPSVDEADKLDYIVAVSGGVLSGLIDAFCVGEFSLDRAEEWGKEQVERVVMKVARAEG